MYIVRNSPQRGTCIKFKLYRHVVLHEYVITLAAVRAHSDKATVLSQKMSKTDLLKEVRKQKELHRREIRRLESELSRLKHKDPLRSCEIMEDEIYFLPQGETLTNLVAAYHVIYP